MNGGFEAYKIKWSWNTKAEKWLKKLCIGKTLNFPCGMSKIGDVRADLDPKVNPDILADLLKPESWSWKEKFDTVICDPPFSFYNKFSWIYRIRDKLVKRRLILCTPAINFCMEKNWKREIYATSQGLLFLRIWQIYTLKSKILDDF